MLADDSVSVVAWLTNCLEDGAEDSIDQMKRLKQSGVVDSQIHLLIIAGCFGEPAQAMKTHYADAHSGQDVPVLDLPNDCNQLLRIIDRERLDSLVENTASFEEFSNPAAEGRVLKIVGVIVRSKTVVTKDRKRMMFMTVDAQGYDIDVVVWPDAYGKLSDKPSAGSLVALKGVREFNKHRRSPQLMIGADGAIDVVQ